MQEPVASTGRCPRRFPPLTFRPLEPAQRAGHLNQAAGQRLIGCFDLPGTPELEALSRFKAQFSLVHELYHQLGGSAEELSMWGNKYCEWSR